MQITLSDIQIRVLGCLMEKEMATPDYYPLSLNALVNACNQKSNRNPVVAYNEDMVLAALDALERNSLSQKTFAGRVPKYEELLVKTLNLIPREASALCILLLRGSQTAGEIKSRSERLCQFTDLQEVMETLGNMGNMDLVTKLPRQPGQKESRFAHLFSGMPESHEEIEMPMPEPEIGKIERMEAEIASLREDIENLKKSFQDFKTQFE